MLWEIEMELKITGGWLKPSKLKEFTGILATEELKEQMKAKKL